MMAFALVAAAMLYSIVLCGLQTAGVNLSDAIVALTDGAVVLAALALCCWSNPIGLAVPLLAVALNFALIGLFSNNIEIKSIRDILVAIAFLALGRQYGDSALARRLLFIVGCIVLAVGLFEYFWPRTFVEHFNVLRFYLMRGTVDQQQAQYIDTSLFVSGMRPGPRFLLPFLGQHRVSSIFLEPVSMGNFGAISVAWGLSLRGHRRSAIFAIVVGLACIVLADARFASLCVVALFIARFIPRDWTSLSLPLAPLAAIAVILLAGAFIPPANDDLPGRLSSSGNALSKLDAASLFGFSPRVLGLLDSGYSYALVSFGLLLCVALWIAYIWLPAPGPQSARYKFLFGLYIAALLCVSGSSLFALKTAALAWFFLGSLIAEESAPAPAPHWVTARPRMRAVQGEMA